MSNAFRKSFEVRAAQKLQLMIPEAINAFRPAPLTHCLTTSAKQSTQYLWLSFSTHETNCLGKPSNSQPQHVQVKGGFASPLIVRATEEAVPLPLIVRATEEAVPLPSIVRATEEAALILGAFEEYLQGAEAPSRK